MTCNFETLKQIQGTFEAYFAGSTNNRERCNCDAGFVYSRSQGKMREGIDFMKSNCTYWVMVIVALGFCLASCTNNSLTVPKADYSTKIVGGWQGTVGNLKETMSIKGDGTFVCRLHPGGFIANMIFPAAPETIHGTWKINDAIITLKITSAQNENFRNSVASSTIVSFKEGELVLKSDRGKTSTFQRVQAL